MKRLVVAHANVVYVSEFNAESIHRIQLFEETVLHLSDNGECLKMSINNKGHVVVSCWDRDRI